MRATGAAEGPTVVCVDGGTAPDVPGTWSASLEWLVGRLAPAFPALRFAEVRYRTRSWHRLHSCREDARSAVREAGASRTLLLGFSMGGAVAVGVADEPSVETVLGLAPWIPDRLSLEPLRGKRLVVVHGSLDRRLPGIPGVSPASSRRGFDRARALDVSGTYTLIPGATHALALRAPWGAPLPVPGSGRWVRPVADELRRFQDGAAG
jgi:dienelactone hydrolase